MQVIKVSEFGGPEVLELGEADIPRPRSGEVLVRVIAAGVGPWDASLRGGGWAGSLPYVPGGEFSGVVGPQEHIAAELAGPAAELGSRRLS